MGGITSPSPTGLAGSEPGSAIPPGPAVTILSSILLKTYHRLGTALLQLGILPAARAVCDAGLSAFQAARELSDLRLRVETAESDSIIDVDEAGVTAGGSSGGDAGGRIGGAACLRGDRREMRPSGARSEERLTERELAELAEGRAAGPEGTALLNAMNAMMSARLMSRKGGRKNLAFPESACKVDDRVAPFHEDFARHGR